MNLFVFGLGYSALAVVRRMAPRLERVWGTSRHPERLSTFAYHGIKILRFDGAGPSDGVRAELQQATHVLVSIPPAADGDPAMRFHAPDLARAEPEAICYLSTVGVYGDHGGAWVDESSTCSPGTTRSALRLEAEGDWRAFAEEHGLALSIMRLAGIYGPGRGPLEKLRRGASRQIIKPGQVFNRIHVDDIAAIADAALSLRAEGIFNCADDDPAPPQDVICCAARLLGVDPPAKVAFDTAALSPMARGFYGECKRVRNDRIKAELGVRLQYPTYREGLRAVLAQEGRPGHAETEA